jgi:deoxynucleoside triphosphate triphosphohydrolase SAMHD1
MVVAGAVISPEDMFKSEIDSLSEKILAPYLSRLGQAARGFVRTPKEFNDPVWGTISLTAFEVVIADSPILQRLRRIRQLGVVHWVYPGAVHTRFEHSLGALHQVEQLLSSVNRLADDLAGSPLTIPSGLTKLVRLAALVHDIGHGFMSHVSEYALRNDTETTSIRLSFASRFSKEEYKISEIAAYYMVRSASFVALVDAAIKMSQEVIPDENKAILDSATVCDLVSRLIIGEQIRPAYPLLSQLISGPFDCDKLDYMRRDARMAGVPDMVDVSRLSRKISLVSVNSTNMPDSLRNLEKQRDNFSLLCLRRSGRRILDEMFFARLVLFSKIYKHQKVLAIEVMVQCLIDACVDIGERQGTKAGLCYQVLDDDLLDLSDANLLKLFGLTNPTMLEKYAHQVGLAKDVSDRLASRNLLVRAATLQRADVLAERGHVDASKFSTFEEVVIQLEDSAALLSFREKCADEIIAIGSVLGRTLPHRRLVVHFTRVVFLDPSVSPGDLADAYILDEQGGVDRFGDAGFNVKAWADAYVVSDVLGYVFCTPELADLTFLALEIVLRRDFQVFRPSDNLDNAKIQLNHIGGIRERLWEAGYYKGLPFDVCPIPRPLRSIGAAKDISDVAKKFAAYEPVSNPCADLEFSDNKVTGERVTYWLRQFPEALIPSALNILKKLEVLDRASFVGAIRRFFDSNKDFQGCWVCPFGDPRDSSAVITYYAGDLWGKYSFREATLETALQEGELPILFVDDFLGSGGQAEDIIRGWFGLRGGADEGHSSLSKQARLSLKARKLAFVFSLGWSEGRAAIERELTSLSLTGEVHLDRFVDTVPNVMDEALYPDSDAKADFLSYCRNVADELLRSTKPGWSKPKRESRLLGYGNRGLLVCNNQNTPSHALTLLWCEGRYLGRPWLPLLVRREKIKAPDGSG